MLFSEPKIPQSVPHTAADADRTFQCSSASRKFLNQVHARTRYPSSEVSVLFSEPKIPQSITESIHHPAPAHVSVLFSEPKIPQLHERQIAGTRCETVSVLFSEPKIPQSFPTDEITRICRVSVLFSEPKIPQSQTTRGSANSASRFQCSSASRKFLNLLHRRVTAGSSACVSVLFSEPKIPQ